MTTYHILGAFDRHNYGDILFPIIHTRFIRRSCPSAEVRYYSVREYSSEQYGGVSNSSIRSLLSSQQEAEDRIIISGGEVLPTDWITMTGHISSSTTYNTLRALKLAIGTKLSNKIIQRITGQKNDFPYIIPRSATSAKIFYTAVGGANFSNPRNKHQLLKIACDLKQSDEVTVRDKLTQSNLISAGVNCKLIPDTALIMSNHFDLRELKERNWKSKIEKSQLFPEDNYFVFQAAKRYIQSEIDNIVRQLIFIQETSGKAILLLPIGRATGHEDHIVLFEIFKRIREKNPSVYFQNSPHILDIMASLAMSKGYIGTSLHGAITAYSYGVKVCGINTRKVRKLGSFLETWMLENDFKSVASLDFSDAFLGLTSTGHKITGKAELTEQKKLIETTLKNYIQANSHE
ncbi:polysaccharide pyruvyl transferase family protein [Pseudomonas sp. BGr12]|uniref:polysaccharide pyruvyl transferase family protein n=1 Tax=Pseudomonas sp. BGr12 TaxID=2936269 RepID=UPI002559CFFD|nr:polysaccharide pyruvyl transferase family protein [Pseudomonas sp. BJa5]MDL2425529.1 polysaccharide pyruvyl transferase family protein [Pseudomonas sp. BJa5]